MKIFKGNLFYKLDILIIIIFFLISWQISKDRFLNVATVSGVHEKYATAALDELDTVTLSKINSKNIYTILNPLKSIEDIKKELNYDA